MGRAGRVVPVVIRQDRRGRSGFTRPSYLAHPVVPGVRDVQDARRVQRQANGICKARTGRRAIVSAVALLARTRDRRNHAGAIHPPHPIVPGVHDVQDACRVHLQVMGGCEVRNRGRATVSAVAFPARARDCRDHACTVHPAHPVVPRVRDVQIAGLVHGDAHGGIEQRIRRWKTVPAEATVRFADWPAARDRRDHAGAVHPADTVIGRVRNIKVA